MIRSIERALFAKARQFMKDQRLCLAYTDSRRFVMCSSGLYCAVIMPCVVDGKTLAECEAARAEMLIRVDAGLIEVFDQKSDKLTASIRVPVDQADERSDRLFHCASKAIYERQLQVDHHRSRWFGLDSFRFYFVGSDTTMQVTLSQIEGFDQCYFEEPIKRTKGAKFAKLKNLQGV